MRKPKHCDNHTCAPKAWRGTPMITGSYDMDASIMHSNSKALPGKLQTHTIKLDPYGPRTGYDGYNGYSGDD